MQGEWRKKEELASGKDVQGGELVLVGEVRRDEWEVRGEAERRIMRGAFRV